MERFKLKGKNMKRKMHLKALAVIFAGIAFGAYAKQVCHVSEVCTPFGCSKIISCLPIVTPTPPDPTN